MADKSAARPRMPLVLDLQGRKRGSLDLSPILSSMTSSGLSSQLPTPSSSVPSTPQLFSRPASPPRTSGTGSDSDKFLTAIAAQERRVLELREELNKAETELGKLKKQWAMHEARKNTSEILQVEQARTPRATDTGPAAQADRRSQHLERKRAESWVKPSQRKVFSGSRHARTLSLLHGRDVPAAPLHSKHDCGKPQLAKALSLPREENPTPEDFPRQANIENPSEADMILETGKQLVGDFRSGFWTFFEDLRQVTIGEDVSRETNATVLSNASSEAPSSVSHSGHGRKSSRNSDAISSPGTKVTTAPNIHNGTRGMNGRSFHMRESSAGPANDALSNGEAPHIDSDGNEEERQIEDESPGSAVSPRSDGSTPRTSVSSLGTETKTTELPVVGTEKTWAALSRLTPSNFTKTASNFMTDWEKSLRPQDDSMTSDETR